MKKTPLTHKLLNLLYHKTRGYRKPMLFDVQRIAHAYCVTPAQVMSALNNLHCAGKIIRTDNLGNPVKNTDPPTHKRLIKLVIDSGGTLPWDKPHRLGIAKMLGVKLSTLRRNKYTVDHLLHTELDGNDRPLQIMILDECAALQYIEDEPLTPTQRYQCHYYKYLTGYTKTRPKKVKPPKPPRRTIAHDILEHILSKGGKVTGTSASRIEILGCPRTSYQKAVLRLVGLGLITKSGSSLAIRDAAGVALFLAPFTETPAKNAPLVNLSPSGLPRQKQGIRESVTSVTVSDSTLSPHAKAVGKLYLTSLLVKQRLQYEIAVRKLRYPKNYEKGQAAIMALYREMKIHDEETDDARRRIQGAMYGKQKAICLNIMQKLQEHLDLGGAVVDALAVEAVRRMECYLPTVDYPENDKANQLLDWLDDVLPVDGIELSWVELFIEYSNSRTVSEFLCRGGMEFLFRCMEWANYEDDTVVKQLVAWDILLYLARIEKINYSERFREQWPNIADYNFTGAPQECWNNGMAVGQALYDFWSLGYKTNSLKTYKQSIINALTANFPARNEDEEIEFICAWDRCEGDLEDFPEYAVLHGWLKEERGQSSDNIPLLPSDRTRYNLAWYKAKFNSVKDYGLPGDVEAINQKIAALLRWPNADLKEQTDKLLYILNSPTRYDDPRLAWEQWNDLATKGRI